MIKTKKINLIGFTGDVVFTIYNQAPPELVFQLNLLAEYAFYCGTDKKNHPRHGANHQSVTDSTRNMGMIIANVKLVMGIEHIGVDWLVSLVSLLEGRKAFTAYYRTLYGDL